MGSSGERWLGPMAWHWASYTKSPGQPAATQCVSGLVFPSSPCSFEYTAEWLQSLSSAPSQHWTPRSLANSSPTRLDKHPLHTGNHSMGLFFSPVHPRKPPLGLGFLPRRWLPTHFKLILSLVSHLKTGRLTEGPR